MVSIVINNYILRLDQFLEQVVNDTQIPATDIRAAINYSLFPGGKRIRPLLVYLSGRLFDVDLNILDIVAGSIELTHCYSLIHDDLPAMDDDDLRRGKPSCHKAFTEATAILAGDGMQALAAELLLNRLTPLLPASQVVKIAQILVKAIGVNGMVSGQSLDLSELSRSSVTEEMLREIHQLKTGRMISACFEMVLATQTEIHAPSNVAIQTYARHIGLVFQMQDDYLDHYAPKEALGKAGSSDLANHKITYADLYSKEKLEQEIAAHYHIALDSLKSFDNKAQPLIDFTRKLQERSNLSSGH